MDCPKIQELSYGEWSKGFHKRLSDRRIPIEGGLDLTFRCNNNCIHCYCNKPAHDTNEMAREMNTGMITNIISEIADEGCLWLLLTGGEPLLRPDFKEIYLYAKKKGMLLTLFTNGTLINEEIADFLAEWKPFSTEITLYGATEKTYESITRVHGSYRRCIKGIELFLERKVPLKLKTMAIRQNVHEIPLMKSYAEGLGLEFRFDAMINPRIDCSQSPLAVRLSPQAVVELDLQAPKRIAEWRRFCERFNGPIHPPEHFDELYHCGGGINSFAIDPYGMLSICVLSNVNAYDLRCGTFREGWENFIFNLRQKRIIRETKCVTCEIKAMCGMCPANGELENRDTEEPVDFLCKVAHLRAKALGLTVKPHGECEYC